MRKVRPLLASKEASFGRSLRKTIVGKRRGGAPQDEREHFIQCPACGRWVDMRDLDDVLGHAPVAKLIRFPGVGGRRRDGRLNSSQFHPTTASRSLATAPFGWTTSPAFPRRRGIGPDEAQEADLRIGLGGVQEGHCLPRWQGYNKRSTVYPRRGLYEAARLSAQEVVHVHVDHRPVCRSRTWFGSRSVHDLGLGGRRHGQSEHRHVCGENLRNQLLEPVSGLPSIAAKSIFRRKRASMPKGFLRSCRRACVIPKLGAAVQNGLDWQRINWPIRPPRSTSLG